MKHALVYQLLKLNRKIKNHRVKYLGVFGARLFGLRHLSIRLDPLVACNLSCLMCPFTAQRQNSVVAKAGFSSADLERLASMLFPRALQLVVGCSYEPTLHKGFVEIVALGKKHGVPQVGLTTNGQQITADMMGRLGEAGLDEITISTHGVGRETYELLMAGASYDRLHESLAEINRARRNGVCSDLKLRLNYTVCHGNLHELPRLLEGFGPYEPNVLQVRPMFGRDYPEGLLSDDDLNLYLEYADKLIDDCRGRGITLLISRDDPRFERKNYHNLIMPAVYLYVDPNQVWREDFDWRNESYDEYCRRTGVMGQLMRGVFTDRETLQESTNRFADSAGYEVIR